MTVILTNARLVLEEEVVQGTIAFGFDGITDVSRAPTAVPGAIDMEGDFVSPGLIECHTDNLEKHFMPRPRVFWPNPLAAALAHDAQMVAAGVTTVYDALCAGGFDEENDYRREIFADMVDAVERGVAERLFRIDHRIHLRCELTDWRLPQILEAHVDRPLVRFASLMNHTPGERQWRNVDHFKAFIMSDGRSEAEADAMIAGRIARSQEAVASNIGPVAALLRDKGVPLASHDDTLPEHVADAEALGCTISEFPTTVEAARAARALGLAPVGGAPNVVRGGSHTGGVSIGELARAGLIDALSSDYVPSALLQAIPRLAGTVGLSLHEAFALVTWRVADMLGLSDRGRLSPGLAADVLRVRFAGETPVVRGVWRAGRQVF
ncbi:amidohydrolase [Agaricicola taiwanensis]|uniref:Amidohydrolase n=1 Tax=Agaricicola taiwanensis TaxID=591372 RepID=A0A8J3E013_9RHOB|nr:alpha-D-ribose 1-methylphosphonate 5-triphosphate diphosphatase [Agaricicola taiwanensis]GGE52970.1 amidohydrolase [Agaricicola taiwanensis]